MRSVETLQDFLAQLPEDSHERAGVARAIEVLTYGDGPERTRREVQEPTRNEHGDEVHPAWGLLGASRVSSSPPGAALFDSDLRHQYYVVVRLSTASRSRNLNHDYIRADREFVEVQMSEAQWASFVSSMNTGDGVPCTITRREDDFYVPGVPYQPRLAESVREVRETTDAAVAKVAEAFAAYTAHKTARNLKTLQYAIENMPANFVFAAESLSKHTENVVAKARFDIEAMAMSKAKQLGIEPGEIGVLELTAGESDG